VYHPFLI